MAYINYKNMDNYEGAPQNIHAETLQSLHNIGLCIPVIVTGPQTLNASFNDSEYIREYSVNKSADSSEAPYDTSNTDHSTGSINNKSTESCNWNISNEHLFPHTLENKSYLHNRPILSYYKLVKEAIEKSEKGFLMLSEIYKYIIDTYPDFCARKPAWRISIRHQLSTNSTFVKMGRVIGQRGFYWAIHPSCTNPKMFELKLRNHRNHIPKKRKQSHNRRIIQKLMQHHPDIIDGTNTKIQSEYVPMESTNIGPDHPFRFLTEYKPASSLYDSDISKHNEKSWESECAVMTLDTCPCKVQREVCENINPQTTSHIPAPRVAQILPYPPPLSRMNHFAQIAQSYSPVCYERVDYSSPFPFGL